MNIGVLPQVRNVVKIGLGSEIAMYNQTMLLVFVFVILDAYSQRISAYTI